MLFGIENLGNSAAVSVPKYLCVDGLYEFVLCSSNLLQKLYVTMFPCNECAKIILQVCSIYHWLDLSNLDP